MKIALLQLNPTVGDLRGNAAKIAAGLDAAGRLGADLAVTTELALLGYPARDLLLNQEFIARSQAVLEGLAAAQPDAPPALVGLARPNDRHEGRPLLNSCAFIRRGKIEGYFYKTLLPTYDVFDEDRYFEPADRPQVLNLDGRVVGVTICEDVWNDRTFWSHPRYHLDPIEQLAAAGAEVLVNLSASPFTVGKQRRREAMLSALSRRHKLPVAMANQAGGNDDLIFDGRSVAFDAQGNLLARAAGFAEDLLLVDLDRMAGTMTEDDFYPESEIWRALVLGSRDYAAKCGFKKVLLGLSGGVDSSLTAALAVEALGPEAVLGVLMPSPYSSQGSLDDALALSANLGIKTLTIPIAGLMSAFEAALAPGFEGLAADVTEENVQARIRGNLLMSLSNKYGALLLTTGNKSELAVGYCTLYGDMSGGLAVISDVPKVMIYRLARWLNRREGWAVIPEPVLAKAPSAELKPGQTDQDSLPPYEILDEILCRHIEKYQSAEEIVAAGFDRAVVNKVIHLVNLAEFKRKQAAPGLKVTDRAFGTGWRMPIAKRSWS